MKETPTGEFGYETSIKNINDASQWSHLGHVQFTQSWAASRGDEPFPVRDSSFGSVTGNSSSGTATGPQDAQCITGMGVPQ